MQLEIEMASAIFGATACVLFRWLSVSLWSYEGKRQDKIKSKQDFCKDLAAGEISVKQAEQYNEEFGASDSEPEAEIVPESEPEEERSPEPYGESAMGQLPDELSDEELVEAWMKEMPDAAHWSQSPQPRTFIFRIVVVMMLVVVGRSILQIFSIPDAEPKNETTDRIACQSKETSAQPESIAEPIGETSAQPESIAEPIGAPVTVGSNRGFPVKLERQKMQMDTVGENAYYRSAYYGTVHVGSPPVPFTVVFDTGSGHLVLPSMYCHTSTCRVHRRYRRSDSTSAKDIDYDGTPVLPGKPRDQITVSFGTGQVTGVFVEDVVCMDGGKTEGALTTAAPAGNRGCMNLRMIAATDMSEDPFKEFQFDGVLGLGLSGLSQTEEFNFVEVAASTWGGLNPHVFAVFLAVDEDEESEITFGGWEDNRLREALSWNAVDDPEQGHWTVRVKSVRVNSEELKFCENGCKAVVDTGTSLLSVPSAVFPEMYERLKHPAGLSGTCRDAGPQLHIELEGTTITLGPEDYARAEKSTIRRPRPRFRAGPAGVLASGSQFWQINSSMSSASTRRDLWCKPTLMTLDLPEPLGPKLFILGEPVLRKYYTIYDAKDKRVGFGRARHSKGLESLPRPPSSMFDMFRMQKGMRA